MDNLIKPYGGELCNLLVDEERAEELKAGSDDYPSLTLNLRQICDLELLLNGGLSPLRGFMDRAAYESVIDGYHLPDGTLWSLPISLDIPGKLAQQLEAGRRLALRDAEGFMLAVLTVGDVWQPDKQREAGEIYGTTDRRHPGVAYLLDQVHDTYIGGGLEGIQLPTHFDFETLRHTACPLASAAPESAIFAAIGAAYLRFCKPSCTAACVLDASRVWNQLEFCDSLVVQSYPPHAAHFPL